MYIILDGLLGQESSFSNVLEWIKIASLESSPALFSYSSTTDLGPTSLIKFIAFLFVVIDKVLLEYRVTISLATLKNAGVIVKFKVSLASKRKKVDFLKFLLTSTVLDCSSSILVSKFSSDSSSASLECS